MHDAAASGFTFPDLVGNPINEDASEELIRQCGAGGQWNDWNVPNQDAVMRLNYKSTQVSSIQCMYTSAC